MTRIALIGGGRIGEALLAGLLSTGDRKPRDLVVVEKNAARTSELTSTYGVWVTKDLHEALEGVSMAVIAVKPVDVPGVLTAIAELNNQDDSADSADTVVVSLAAGISTATMERLLSAGTPVVRVMPNTPMLVGKGASAVCAGRYATEAHLEAVEQILGAMGVVRRVPETQMDAVTAVSGSGPAYVFLAIEAMIDSGVALGLTREVASDLAVQTFFGAAAMVAESGHSPAELRAAVTSPAGTTAAGVRVLERMGMRSAFYEAMAAVVQRAGDLGAGAADD